MGRPFAQRSPQRSRHFVRRWGMILFGSSDFVSHINHRSPEVRRVEMTTVWNEVGSAFKWHILCGTRSNPRRAGQGAPERCARSSLVWVPVESEAEKRVFAP